MRPPGLTTRAAPFKPWWLVGGHGPAKGACVTERDALKERVFGRVVSTLARPLTDREQLALATACDLALMGHVWEQAHLEEYVVARALELAQ